MESGNKVLEQCTICRAQYMVLCKNAKICILRYICKPVFLKDQTLLKKLQAKVRRKQIEDYMVSVRITQDQKSFCGNSFKLETR